LHHHKDCKNASLPYFSKHVPTKRYYVFWNWIDAEGEFFDTAHFSDSLQKYPFQGGGCYLLLGTVEVDYHFPTITISKMAKMPFIPDPRYSNSTDRQYKAHQQKEDVSMTHRAIPTGS
jgi:DNA polymerase-3 subunit alpha/error-prone DNA polymerase